MEQTKKTDYSGNPDLQTQLLVECEAMAKYAFASGQEVPGTVMEVLGAFSIENMRAIEPSEESKSKDVIHKNHTKVNEKILQNPSHISLKQLGLVHNRLAALVKPATPGAILFMERESARRGLWRFLGAVPLVRRMMAAAILSLTALIAISLSPYVDGHVNWAAENGLRLLIEEMFLLSAAGIGASFAALFKMSSYITRKTFDPKYDTSYWMKFVLGLVSGMILALLIPIEVQEGSAVGDFTKPLLAMLGGFSAEVVYRILKRLIATIESLVRGDSKDMIDAEIRLAKADIEEEQVQNRLKLASNLMSVKDQLSPDEHPELSQRINEMLEDLMPVPPGTMQAKEPEKQGGA